MLRYALPCTFVLAAACGGPSTPPATATSETASVAADAIDPAAVTAAAAAELESVLDDIWELSMQRYPRWATYEGDRRFDDRVFDPTPEAREAHEAAYQALVDRAAAIDPQALAPMDRDTRAMLLDSQQRYLERKICRSEEWSIDGLGGPQVDWAMLPVFHTIRDEADLVTLEARYRLLGDQMDGIIANYRRGLADGYVATQDNVRRALEQTENLLATELDDHPMLRIQPTDDSASYDTSGLRAALAEVVQPALGRYRDLLRNEVLPAARTDVGVGALPDGEACYVAMMENHIGPGFDPAAVHATGQEQLAWAHAGMLEVADELGLELETAQEVIDWMREQPEHFVDDEDELLRRNREAVDVARARMGEAFGRLPETPVEVWAMEAYRAADAPAAYYYSAPEDGSRPGVYYVNTHDPGSKPLYNLEALAFHEAIPGHHLQIALAQEMPDVHIWRRSTGQTAYVEGWALYSEVLADELDWYSSPQQRFGMYNFQAWRASRLVVDTGMHAMGWSREDALAFLIENTSLHPDDAANEIDRYIAWPGQALAYMIGRLEIEALRADAEAALGEDFDLSAFHDAVLGNGAVPLTVLRANIHDWIAAQR